MRPILEQQVERLRRHDPERTVTLDVAVGVPPVNADPARLVQVIRALLDNAKQYSPSASPIVVRCYVDDLRGKVDRDGAAHAVVVEIEDRGVGIASAEQARIFEPFSRVDEGLNRQSQGCGMGLTIARGIIRAHGGRMWVVSTPEQGSTFGFYIPA
jgi:signal transduction histidine kinase